MSKIKLTGENSGYVEISAGQNAGNNTLQTPTSGTRLVAHEGSQDVTLNANLTVNGVLTYDDVTNIDSVGVITARAGVKVPDSQKIFLGTGDDLQIYHDGSTSYIKDAGNGNLNIETNGSAVVLTKGQSENLAKFIVDGAAELYYDNSKKFETTSSGVKVSGSFPDFIINDTDTTNDNFRILHNGGGTQLQVDPNNVSSGSYLLAAIDGTERLRITSAGNIGIDGVTAPRAKFDFGSGTGNGTLNQTISNYQAVFESPQGTGNYSRNIGFAVGTNGIGAAINAVDDGGNDATGLIFATGTAGAIVERLRIESDGGTVISNAGTFPTSTNETLNVQGEGHNGHGTSNTRSVFNVTGAITSNTNGAGLWIGARTNENTAIIGTRTASGNLAIETYNGGWGERLRITSAGNVGIGDNTPENALTIRNIGSFEGDANSFYLGSNFTGTGQNYTGSNKHAQRFFFNNAASNGYLRYENTGTTGTAGNAITWQERFRITSAGKIGINEASPTARVDINHPHTEQGLVVRSRYGDINTAMVKFDGDPDSNGGDGNVLHIHGGNSRTDSEILHVNSTGEGTIFQIRGDGRTRVYKHLQLEHASNTAKIIFNEFGANDIKAQIEMDQVSGSSGMLRFYTEGTTGLVARMLITPQGYIKATPRVTDGSHGAQSLTGNIHEFANDNANWVMRLTHTSGAASENEGLYINYKTTSPNNTGNSFLQANDSNGVKFRFASNGGLYNYQSNNSNLCDEREKKNIVSLDSKWDKVKNWELKKFHYNEDADSDDLRYGVIAQQVEEHCPEVVSEWTKQQSESAVLDEDGNVVTPAVPEITRKGVKEQQMMWMAIKALQEAQTRIETLEAQVAALQSP